jgi:peptide/nickel transport system substrate-binding protein
MKEKVAAVSRGAAAIIVAIIIAIAAIAGAVAIVSQPAAPSVTTVVQTQTVERQVVSTITQPVTSTVVTTVGGEVTTLTLTTETTQLLTTTVATTTAVTQVTTQVVTTTVAPTTPPPAKPTELILTPVGAHWTRIRAGLDPVWDGPRIELMPLVYETLYDFDPVALQKGEYRIIPWLAEEMPDVSEDGTVYIVKLRKGVRFHSGNEMTADDVVYSVERYYFYEWEKLGAYLVEPRLKLFRTLASVEKIDDYTVKFTLSSRDPSFIDHLTTTFFAVMDSKVLQEHEIFLEDYGMYDRGATWTYKNAEGDAGSGPYTLEEWKFGERYVVRKVDDYWGGPPELNLPEPYFERVIIIPTAEDADARLKLAKGDVHIATDLLAETVNALKKQEGVKAFMGFYPFGMGLWMHTVSGPLQDWRVRKAIKMAINYTAIEEVTFGGAVIAQGLFMAGMPGWEKNARYFPGAQYEEAQALLDEAGWPVQEDGWRFTINLYIRPAPRWGLDFTSLALQVKDDLAKVQINAVPIVVHVSEYYQHVWTPSEEMMWIQPWDYRLPTSPWQGVSYWAAPDGGLWWYGWNRTTQPPEIIDAVDEWYYKALEELDPMKRIEYLQNLEAAWLEYGPAVNLANALSHIGLNENIEGFYWSVKAVWPSIFYMTWAD